MKLRALSTFMIRGLACAALVPLLVCPPSLRAEVTSQDHIVSSGDLQQQVQSSSASRQKDIATVTNFLSSPMAEQAMKDAKIDPTQVRTAIPTLSDQELANLSARASHAQQQFAAGMLGSGMLVLIIVLLAVIIIVAAIH